MSKEDKSKIDRISTSTLNLEISNLLTSGKKIATISVGSTPYNILAPATYAWSEITDRPTKLSQFTDDVVAGKYLPLSGGTITGGVLTLDSSLGAYSFLRFKDRRIGSSGYADTILQITDVDNVAHGALGVYGGSSGVQYYYFGCETDAHDGNNFRIYTDKVAFGGNTLIHSGNIGDYKAGDSDKLGGYDIDTIGAYVFGGAKRRDIPQSSDLNDYVVGSHGGWWSSLDNTTYTNGPMINFGMLVTRINSYYSAQLALGYSSQNLMYRSQRYGAGGVHVWSDWKTIAFTDSTVASAYKLVTSAGADAVINANGCTYVYGDLWVWAQDASDRVVRLRNSPSDLYTRLKADGSGEIFVSGNYALKFGTANTARVFINPSGNVTIGGYDLAGTSVKLYVDGNVKAPSFIGNLDGTYVNKLTGYTKAAAISALAATDTLNTALGKLEYKADVAYNLVKGAYDGDGTIENLAEILKVLEGISDTDTIQAIVGKYLPLSGGTIEGTNTSPLNINTSATTEVGLRFNMNEKSVAWVGYTPNIGAYLYSYGTGSGTHKLGLSDAGVGFLDSNTLIHSGNIGSYKAGDSALFDGHTSGAYYRSELGAIPSSGNIAAIATGSWWTAEAKGTTNPLPTTYASLIAFGKSYYSPQLCVFHDATRAWLRGVYNKAEGFFASEWHELAFIDSNVASATKLATARTIWGQSFDGTGNVSGNLNLGSNVIYGGSNYNIIDISDGSGLSIGYGIRSVGSTVYWAKSHAFYIGNSHALTINSSGNVGIGTTSPAYKLDVAGVVRATSFIKLDSSNSYLLLGGGDHKAISDFLLKSEVANQELSSNLTTITKSLTVTADWMDTGISSTNIPTTGTYIVQVSVHNSTDGIWYCYWSGVMSWYASSTDDAETDEIILHRAGHAYGNTIYLRTVMQNNSVLKLQIAANKTLSTAATYTFKFKRVI